MFFKHTGKPKDVSRKDSTYQKSKNSYSSDDCEAEFFFSKFEKKHAKFLKYQFPKLKENWTYLVYNSES